MRGRHPSNALSLERVLLYSWEALSGPFLSPPSLWWQGGQADEPGRMNPYRIPGPMRGDGLTLGSPSPSLEDPRRPRGPWFAPTSREKGSEYWGLLPAAACFLPCSPASACPAVFLPAGMHFGGNPEPLRQTGETLQIPVLELWSQDGTRRDARRDGTTETRGPPRGLEQSRKCPRVGGGALGSRAATGSASAAAGERGRSAAGWSSSGAAPPRPPAAPPRPR